MEIIVKGVFKLIAACGGKVRFTFAISIRRILARGVYRN